MDEENDMSKLALKGITATSKEAEIAIGELKTPIFKGAMGLATEQQISPLIDSALKNGADGYDVMEAIHSGAEAGRNQLATNKAYEKLPWYKKIFAPKP